MQDVVTVSGYNGNQGNDVFWNIYAQGTGTNGFLGQSSFHLSCSDVNMNTADDCGKAEGDNKGSTTCVAGSLPTTTGNCVNLWNLAGMTGPIGSGSSASLVCPGFGTPAGQTTCNVTLAPYVCTKPITSLTMQWTGASCIGIGGTAGANPGTPIDLDNVCPGDTITVSGYNGNQGNDVFWNICNAGTHGAACTSASANFIGQSSFHLSCSDVDMNTADDCGKIEGNNKGTVTCLPGGTNASCINLWVFEGMTGPAGSPANASLDCGNRTGQRR